MLLLSDPVVAAVPALECGEPLVDLRKVPELAVDPRKQDPVGAWALLRAGIATRLLVAQRSLPPDVGLLIIEGYRPAALQRRYFDNYRARLAHDHPDWEPQRLDAEASTYVSPPAVAPHPCGAAVDVTLVRDGQELDLGTEVDTTPAQSAGACFTAAENITGAAQGWRRVMGRALSAAGLVNYPSEWWHWSHGDRYWAAVTGASHALYTPR